MSIAAPPDARDPRSRVAWLAERLRPGLARRATGVAATLALEALLLLLLLTLSQAKEERREVPLAVVAFDAKDYGEQEPAAKPEPRPQQEAASAAPRQPKQAAAPAPLPRAADFRRPKQAPQFDLSQVPSRQAVPAPKGPQMGPAFTPRFGDSQRVGTAPNGQPMYAAQLVVGPGWGLIACRTVADFRVEDCVGLDEYPQGSNIVRAVLAAAWQFRVRPVRINGVSQVGSWVQIRIVEYDLERK